jgi:peptide deformylase
VEPVKHVLKVARMGNPVLRRKAEPVDPAAIPSREFQDFVDSMLLTMHEYSGIGLAAPQVHKSLRVVVFHEGAGLTDPDGEPLTALINPEVTPLTEDLRAIWEGCLSVPGLRGRVSRPERIRVTGLDRRGREVDLELEDFDAVVTQHEFDHLDGVLYTDKVDDPTLLVFEEEFERFWAEKAEEDGDFVDDEG